MEAEAEQRSWEGLGGCACRARAACPKSPVEVAGAQHEEKLALVLDHVSQRCQAEHPTWQEPCFTSASHTSGGLTYMMGASMIIHVPSDLGS